MSYQRQYEIDRRTLLKGAGFLALCGVTIPLQSLSDAAKLQAIEQKAETQCPVCKSVHGNDNCSA
jgi:organic hydroperoxide reductase OsmC/OhrA